MQGNSDEVMHLDDPRVPDPVRQHAQRFRQGNLCVVALSQNEFIVLDVNGKVLDLIWLEQASNVAL